MTLRSLLALSALALLTACEWVVAPEAGERLGVISFYDDPVVVSVPETVEAGVPFEATVLTYGGGCTSEGETDVAIRGDTVEITPTDVHSGHRACTDILNIFEHSVMLTLSQPGMVLLRFRGGQQPEDRRITIERSVSVR